MPLRLQSIQVNSSVSDPSCAELLGTFLHGDRKISDELDYTDILDLQTIA